jgi:type IV pilus assembly protein PilB
MRISDSIIEKVLSQAGLATPEQISILKTEAEKIHRPIQELVIDRQMTDEKSLTQAYAAYSQMEYVEIDPKEVSLDILNRIPERIARQYNAVIYKVDDEGIQYLAMEDPDDIQAVNFLQKQLGENLKIAIATKDNIATVLENYRGDVDKELAEAIDIQRVDEEPDLENIDPEDVSENSPVAQTINLLLEYAVRSNASDIHIEPREDYVQIRYRVDGILKEVNRLPRNVSSALISRIKILANLKIDERRVPQDGRFKIKVAGKQYALRVSTLPIADGEKIAMRILNESSTSSTLEELGYWGVSLDKIKLALTNPDGMVLITGPTGSGKSTSLFSVLTMLNSPDVNISTIEDPVEYKIKGVNQTQTNQKAGMTFANGLRSLLRQDPNIIMVGEIRDSETSGLAIQAALTGHLVFSTLHTNDAATTLPRLLDMGSEPFLIASTVKAIVGQRLMRKLNVKTRKSVTPSPEEVASIKEMLQIDSPEKMKAYHELEIKAKELGIGGDAPLSTSETEILTIWKADENDNTGDSQNGFKGRVGVYEVLVVTDPIRRLIMSNATSDQIKDEAEKEGMMTMQTDGIIKALRGITTFEEVIRISREQL